MSDARIKNCINRYDSSAYTPMQFLDAMSHSMGAHTAALNDHLRGDSDDDDDGADEDEARHRMLQLRLKFPKQGHPTTAAKCV